MMSNHVTKSYAKLSDGVGLMSIRPTKLLILASENGQGKWYARLDKDSKAQEVTLVFYQREGKRSLPQRISDKLDGIMSARSAASKYIESMGWCPIAPSSAVPTNVRALGGKPPRKPEALAKSTKFRKPEVGSKTLSEAKLGLSTNKKYLLTNGFRRRNLHVLPGMGSTIFGKKSASPMKDTWKGLRRR